jgi:hypothetical protein
MKPVSMRMLENILAELGNPVTKLIHILIIHPELRIP